MRNMCQCSDDNGWHHGYMCTARNSSSRAKKCTFFKKVPANRQCRHANFGYSWKGGVSPVIWCSCQRACDIAREEYRVLKKLENI